MTPPIDARRVGRILLVSLDNLGDTVFASALIPPLRARFPDATIDVWSKAYAADVARLIPTVGVVHAADPFWDKAPGRGKGRVLPFARSVLAVRRGRYDVALLAAAPWRTAAAVAATGIPVRIGLGRRRSARFLTHVLPAEDKHRPVLSELARLLAPLGIERTGLRYALDPAPLAPRVAALRQGLIRPFVAVHPFASKRDRCVAVPEWIAVARALAREGLDVVWIGSPTELDEVRAAAESARGAAEGLGTEANPAGASMRGGPPAPGSDAAWHYADRLGDGSLAASAAILSLAALFVGHDSGPLHVAGAFGVPVLGVFAPGEPDRTFPQGIGPARIIARDSPAHVSAGDILAELGRLRALAG